MAIVTGRVVEYYTGRGVSGVLVTAGGQTSVTDVNGYFTITNVPIGRHALRFVHRDFAPYSTPIAVSQHLAYSIPQAIRIRSVVRAL